jgi:catechol 2,3-dioxygenase-like lactoylglutathione lyase family enzyme
VEPRTLDHVALWVADRDAIADFVTRHVGMHVIERTDRFTLVGAEARRGKLTLFAAEGPRERGALDHIALRVSDLAAARAELPNDLAVEDGPGGVSFDVSEGLRLRLVEASTDSEYDLDHVTLRTADPERAAEGYVQLGFEPAAPAADGAPRLEVGGAYLELRPGGAGTEPERPLLNHLAVLVDSTDEHIAEAEDAGLEIADVVDAANTYAVFVWAPERVKVEYVEHKPTFSLT